MGCGSSRSSVVSCPTTTTLLYRRVHPYTQKELKSVDRNCDVYFSVDNIIICTGSPANFELQQVHKRSTVVMRVVSPLGFPSHIVHVESIAIHGFTRELAADIAVQREYAQRLPVMVTVDLD